MCVCVPSADKSDDKLMFVENNGDNNDEDAWLVINEQNSSS